MQWLEEYAWAVEGLGVIAVVSFVATLALVPFVILQLPADYFVRHRRDPLHRKRQHLLIYGIGIVLKNLLGITLLAAGILMLFLPGQGLLTMLIGLMLTNFPGKYRLEQAIIRRQGVARTVNAIRRKAGKPALIIPEDDE